MRSSWLQDDDDTESSSTADDMEEDDDDEEVKLAVEPVVESGGASGSSESSSANNASLCSSINKFRLVQTNNRRSNNTICQTKTNRNTSTAIRFLKKDRRPIQKSSKRRIQIQG